MLEILSTPEIQELIGPSLYEEVSDFLEKLSNDENEIIAMNRKAGQIKLLLSLSQNQKLSSVKFWKDVHSRFNGAERKELLEKGINPLDSSQIFIEACLKYTFQAYGLVYEKEVEPEPTRTSVTVCEGPKAPFKTLKDFQTKIFWEILKHLNIPRSRFIVQMPTGSGKTRTAMEVIAHQLKVSPQKNIIWLAHSIELVDQAATGFEEVWAHVGTHDVDVRIVDGDHNGLEGINNSNSSIIISTLQSMRSYLNNSLTEFETFTKSCSLLVIDEAHMSLAATYEELIQKIVRNGCLLMGLTATPGRALDDDENNHRLAKLYYETPVRLECPDGGNVFSYLRKIGVMAATSMDIIQGSNESLSSAEVASFESSLSVPASFLRRLGLEEQRNLVIVYKLLGLIKENPKIKILLFACNVKHSKFLTSILKYKGIKAAHVDGNTLTSARKTILDDFKTGDTNVLSNFGVLATGFDAPKTDVVFIARPTASIVLYSQIIGRGLRGPNIGGTKECKIINVKDNIVGLPNYDKIYDYFDDYYVK